MSAGRVTPAFNASTMRRLCLIAPVLWLLAEACRPPAQRPEPSRPERVPDTSRTKPRPQARDTSHWRRIGAGPTHFRFLSVNTFPLQMELAAGDPSCGLATMDGDALGEMEIVLTGNGGAWYQNGFYSARNDVHLFRRFYPAQTAPQTPTPVVPPQLPGTFGPQNGFYNLRVELEAIECRSRYGGSIELRFQMAEDLQYELGDATYLWDLKGLSMRIYVVPVPGHFTAPTQASNATQHVEFSYDAAVRYSRASLDVSELATPVDTPLVTALQAAANAIEQATFGAQSVRANASAITYGFLRKKFDARFPNDNEIVETLELTDDFVDLTTRAVIRTMVLSVRVNDIDVNTEPGGEEYEISIDDWNTGVGPSRSVVSDVRIDSDESTSWYTVVSFPATDCAANSHHFIKVWITEKDTFSDDTFGDTSQEFSFDCAALAAEPAGYVEEQRTDDITVRKWRDERVGWMSVSLKLRIVNR